MPWPADLVIWSSTCAGFADLSSTALAALVGVQAHQRSRLKTLTLVCGDASGTEMALARSGMKGEFRAVTDPPAMVMVNASGWRVEKVIRTFGDRVPVVGLRVSWRGYWQAGCLAAAKSQSTST